MLFNSIEFFIFLSAVFLLYWYFSNNSSYQNSILFISSLIFYAWWDWRFLGLLLALIFFNFYISHALKIRSSSCDRYILFAAITVNLIILSVFKYYNFFIEGFSSILNNIGFNYELKAIHLILPVGISFYTFQNIAYLIDVYKQRIQPEQDIIIYSIFISFFPQLIAGPIERASNILPQLKTPRTIDSFLVFDGLKQILWGLFMKVVIADNCAYYSDQIFDNYEAYTGSTLFFGALFFTFQIYGDFSGYSNIAIGTGKLLSIRLSRNFYSPYFSLNVRQFWNNWHITLSSWFKDYIYIPFGGNKLPYFLNVFLVITIFLLSGIWHGANYTFIFWGFYHALLLVLYLFIKNHFKFNFNRFFSLIITFSSIVIGWIFFRSDSIDSAFQYLDILFSSSFFYFPEFYGKKFALFLFFLVAITLFIENISKDHDHPLLMLLNEHKYLRYFVYYLLLAFIFFIYPDSQQFLYFQF
jgi:alginate O-acetyltransferase complex protein AlgI